MQGSGDTGATTRLPKVLSAAALSAALLLGGALEFQPPATTAGGSPPPAAVYRALPGGGGVPHASAAGFNEPQRVVAETWRVVDRLYLDRTFGGQDWFALRQRALQRAEKGELSSEAALNKALGDMLASLGDRYTRYLPPAKYDSLVGAASGELAGIGVTLSTDTSRGLTLVTGIEPGGPAAEAGLRAGDLLTTVSGEDGRGLEPDDAAALIRGAEGTRVGLVVERAPAAATEQADTPANAPPPKLDFILTRRKIKVQGVVPHEARVGGRRVGVIRIKSFSSGTAADVSSALAGFKGADALVVDVRGNAGGLLPGGMDTAALFLDQGRDLISIVRKSGPPELRATADAGPQAQGPPLLVLVDGATASAAEVFAAAVRENGRARLAGAQTFGKGVIQSVEPVGSSGGGVAVTVARYETPLHKSINKVGLGVDVKVDCPLDKPAEDCLSPGMLWP